LDPGNETLVITEHVSQITVQGVLVEATVQTDGLRLRKLVKTSNRDAVIQGKLLDLDNELKHRKEDLLHTEQEIKRLQQEMIAATVKEQRDSLYNEMNDKIDIKQNHEQEIKRLESQELLQFDYQLQTSGSSKLLSPARNTLVDFLTKVVSWCPLEPSDPVCETETKKDAVPISDIRETQWLNKNMKTAPREVQESKVQQYRASAEQGNAYGQRNLGVCYENGHGVEQDYKQAVAWFRKSAEQGNAYGQNNLGVCYQYGHGVEQDYKQAVAWYGKSAEQGHASAQNSLGYCYKNGQGVEQDNKQAVAWYRKSAEQGYASGKRHLSQLLAKDPNLA
jgi:hypothetical protein